VLVKRHNKPSFCGGGAGFPWRWKGQRWLWPWYRPHADNLRTDRFRDWRLIQGKWPDARGFSARSLWPWLP